MRIRIVQTPIGYCIDGLRLDQFLVGNLYDVSEVLGALLVGEGWAEGLTSDEPALAVPLSEFGPDNNPPNLIRERYHSISDPPITMVGDRPLRFPLRRATRAPRRNR